MLACPTVEDLKKIIKMNTIFLLLLKISSLQKQDMGLTCLAQNERSCMGICDYSPITAAIIAAVEAEAHVDKMDKLHFKSKHGIIIYYSSQIAGVDYNEEALQNEDDPYQYDLDK